MLAGPASFRYKSAAWENPDQKSTRRSGRSSVDGTLSRSRPVLPKRTTEPVSIPSSKPSNVTAPEREYSESTHSMSSQRSATMTIGRKKSSSHDPNALPPAVAALLAVTAIPPRRPNRYRNRPGRDHRISIEELVGEWKNDEKLRTSCGSAGSPALSVLLEDIDYADDRDGKDGELGFLQARSTSSESMPSLDSDDRSILSVGSPSTPGSLHSRKSYTNLKKEKSRSLPAAEDCASNHPLIPRSEPEDDDLLQFPLQTKSSAASKPRFSFKSNLTASLQTLKEAAVHSFSSLGRAGSVAPMGRNAAPHMDDMLWSHPFLFPRFSSEVRPAMGGTPSEAERRYHNPMPLTFEEQEAPFQEALHAPFLAQAVDGAPTIQMQTYNRGRRRASPKRSVANPSSEAGRALLGGSGVRQREVRENPDFLRVVVLEMNMRREGKLESGRAKIWLPPRQSSPPVSLREAVPKRWVGESA